MKKYIIKNADGSEQNAMPAAHDTRKEAMLTILRYATKSVEDEKDDWRVRLPVNYMVEEVKEDDACECIPDFVSAIAFLQVLQSRGLPYNEIRPCDFLGSLNTKHLEALDALNKLFTIAQAWNLIDGFVPDFSDWNQDKWFPRFKYDKDSAVFVFAHTARTPSSAGANFGSRLCFKSSERAAQFGKQFADLYNKVFL